MSTVALVAIIAAANGGGWGENSSTIDSRPPDDPVIGQSQMGNRFSE